MAFSLFNTIIYINLKSDQSRINYVLSYLFNLHSYLISKLRSCNCLSYIFNVFLRYLFFLFFCGFSCIGIVPTNLTSCVKCTCKNFSVCISINVFMLHLLHVLMNVNSSYSDESLSIYSVFNHR